MGRRVLMANMQMERQRFGDLGGGLLTPAESGGGRWSVGGSGGGDLAYIEHTVSKFDTLVGVAIKYGVEVVDIKRMNGLIADQQMFALKSLKIPVRGRHPPSLSMSNGSTKHEVTHNGDTHSDVFDSMIKSLRLSSSCQTKLNDEDGITESFEMTVYRKETTHYYENEHKLSQTYNPIVGVYRKSKILINGASVTNDKSNKYFDKLVRRRNGKNTIY